MNAKAYQTKSKKLTGSNYGEVHRKAFGMYLQIKKRSKRRVYLRSTYFHKDKIFLSLFWHHLNDKHHKERLRRLKYFPCGLELIKKSALDPISIESSEDHSQILHRFIGITSESDLFYVQIKENKRNGQKYLISVFPHGK